MCGIIGFSGKKNRRLLNLVLSSIKHRGPDEKIYFNDNLVNIGMARLSIIDLTKNLYPMRFKKYILFFNGEIYNFYLLKKELEKDGVKFKTNSDAEVILPLFSKYGPKAFTILEGMYAIFIYDQKNKIIYLARDKAGEKPLYYYHKADFFSFSSELKGSLITSKNEKLTVNKQNLINFLYFGYIFAPNTIVNGVHKIPPAHFLTYNLRNNKLRLSVYWKPKRNKFIFINSERKLVKQLDKLISNSVKEKLIADVPLGCFLSGGIDSSLITYFASCYRKGLNTFSVNFPGFEDYDESFYAQKAANIYHTKHTEIACTPEKVREIIENIGEIIDEPIIDPAVLPLYILAREARKKVKVVLTGEGADELFAGYKHYSQKLLFTKLNKLMKNIPYSFSLVDLFFPNYLQRIKTDSYLYYTPQIIWNRNMLTNLLKPYYKNRIRFPKLVRYNKKIYDDNPLSFMQKNDFSGFLAEQLLMKVDKTTMYHGLEARCPYLDFKIIEFALFLPEKWKVKWLTGKYLLKKVAEQYLPKKLVWRQKHGLDVPLKFWFRKELEDIVDKSKIDIEEFPSIFNTKYYQYIIRQHLEEKEDYSRPIWGVIVLLKFLKKYNFNDLNTSLL